MKGSGTGLSTKRGSAIRLRIEELNPAYFAMVMATGIIAIATHQLGFTWIALSLDWLNRFMYGLLWIAFIVRVLMYPRAFFADLISHSRGVGYFTVVAGTCVLGSQLVVLDGHYKAALGLWALGIALWAALTYAVFTAFTVDEKKPTLEQGINGGWLVAVVATQSVSILGELLVSYLQPYEQWINFMSLSLWLWGGMFYIWLISLIFYRYTFFTFHPSDLMPPYWINMGAMAISTLAGATLIAHESQSDMLAGLAPFLTGFTILFWATATWWIPMLVVLGFWRHVLKRFKLAYDPLYWGAVFPLGMYTACTWKLAHAADLSFLLVVPHFFIYVALVAWALTFIGLLHRLIDLFTFHSHTAHWVGRILP